MNLQANSKKSTYKDSLVHSIPQVAFKGKKN